MKFISIHEQLTKRGDRSILGVEENKIEEHEILFSREG